MKTMYKGIALLLALTLALSIGFGALAEGETTTQPAEASETATDTTALQDALTAYANARHSSKLTSLEEELNAYVAAGTLTQEQADLILSYYKEQESLRNGICPNCGYQFQQGGRQLKRNNGLGKGTRNGGGKHGKQTTTTTTTTPATTTDTASSGDA